MLGVEDEAEGCKMVVSPQRIFCYERVKSARRRRRRRRRRPYNGFLIATNYIMIRLASLHSYFHKS